MEFFGFLGSLGLGLLLLGLENENRRRVVRDFGFGVAGLQGLGLLFRRRAEVANLDPWRKVGSIHFETSFVMFIIKILLKIPYYRQKKECLIHTK